MIDARADGWLTTAEIDLLTTFSEVALPFPFQVPAGATDRDGRLRQFATARAGLQARGLADHRGPLGLAEDFVHLLRNGAGVLDVLVARRDHVLGAAVLALGPTALLATQELRGGADRVRLTAMSVHDAVDQLARFVPAHPPAMISPFSLPRTSIQRLHGRILTEKLSGDALEAALRAEGIDDQTARRMITHLQPVLGNGQAGTAVRGGYDERWSRAGEEVRWLDTTRGRVRLAGDGDWMSVNPFTAEDLRGELRRLAGDLWF